MITLVGQVPGTKKKLLYSAQVAGVATPASIGRKLKEARRWDDERKQTPGTAGGKRGGGGRGTGVGDTFTSTLCQWVSDRSILRWLDMVVQIPVSGGLPSTTKNMTAC